MESDLEERKGSVFSAMSKVLREKEAKVEADLYSKLSTLFHFMSDIELKEI